MSKGRDILKILIKIAALTVISFMVLTTAAAADTPYYSYNSTEWSTAVPAPDTYTYSKVISGEGDQATGKIIAPTDFCFDGSGVLYVLEKRGRVLRYDASLNFLGFFTPKSGREEYTFKNPGGIFVAEDQSVYIADTDDAKVLQFSPAGELLQTFLKPEDEAYTAQTFQPSKVLVSKDGMVYVLCNGVYQGMVVYDAAGNFDSFFGSPKIQVTAKILMDKIWKRILSQTARDKIAQYVPVSFSNFDIDRKGFIYTCSAYTSNNVEQIRRLNHLGENIFPYTGNFGEEDVVYYQGKSIVTSFVDISVSSNEIVWALDSTRCRVYGYDQGGNALFNFGTEGEMNGASVRPIAVENYGDAVYVLDTTQGKITQYKPTEYGELILQAATLYAAGEYGEAMTYWQRLLKLNTNLEMAYNGIGESLMKTGNYEEAVTYFRLGYDRQRESKAFSQYRAQLFKENFGFLFAGLLILVALLFCLTNRKLMKRLIDQIRRRKRG